MVEFEFQGKHLIAEAELNRLPNGDQLVLFFSCDTGRAHPFIMPTELLFQMAIIGVFPDDYGYFVGYWCKVGLRGQDRNGDYSIELDLRSSGPNGHTKNGNSGVPE